MVTTENYWGDLPSADTERTPLIILREQATVLTKKTNGILAGVVRTATVHDFNSPLDLYATKPPKFRTSLVIEAPALDGYVFQVLDAEYELALYPVAVYDSVNRNKYDCADEAQFIEVIKTILTSVAVHKAIGMLLAQSRSEQQEAA